MANEIFKYLDNKIVLNPLLTVKLIPLDVPLRNQVDQSKPDKQVKTIFDRIFPSTKEDFDFLKFLMKRQGNKRDLDFFCAFVFY